MAIGIFQHTPSGAVIFGANARATVGEKTLLKKHTKILLITDAAVRAAGVVDDVEKSLGDRVVMVDSAVVADGDTDHVEALAARAADAGVTAICAVGGGSVIDSAKGTAAVMATGKALKDLEGVAGVRTKTIPVVAIPTTSGTGSEATQFAVIKSPREKTKRILVDTNLIPTLAILDPTALLGLPPGVTAATAVDAVTHAVEAAVSRMKNPIGSALCTEALRLMVGERALARALSSPSDVDARADCLMAAHLAGQAVNTSMLGSTHALAHVLGAGYGVPHGVANGLFLTDVMRANATKVSAIYAGMGHALGCADDCDAVIDTVEAFIADVAGLPRRLRDAAVGLTEDALPALAAAAAIDPDNPTNPVRLDETALLSILRGRW
jgi:alcohol dehydrogenase